MRNNELPLEVVYALESERDIISKQIYKEKLPATLTPDEDGTFIIEIPLNRDFFIEISLDKKFKLSVSFYQSVEDYDRLCHQIVPKKHFVPQSVLNLGQYSKGSYILNTKDSISEPAISAIRVLVSERRSLIKMCHVSSCYTRDGQLKKKSLYWPTEATLLSIDKKSEGGHIVTGIPKSKQAFYDALPGIHGSNGTYAEHTTYYWALTYRVKYLAYEWRVSGVLFEDINDYITNELKPRLGWERISPQRLERLNKCIKGRKLKVITRDVDEAPGARSFFPENSNDRWNEFLNDCFNGLS